MRYRILFIAFVYNPAFLRSEDLFKSLRLPVEILALMVGPMKAVLAPLLQAKPCRIKI